jgi:hypothetical protein
VRLQRQRRVLSMRLKVPPVLNQFVTRALVSCSVVDLGSGIVRQAKLHIPNCCLPSVLNLHTGQLWYKSLLLPQHQALGVTRALVSGALWESCFCGQAQQQALIIVNG